jgi:hypothetical protein
VKNKCGVNHSKNLKNSHFGGNLGKGRSQQLDLHV